MPTVRVPIDLTWTAASGSPGVNVWHARIDSVADPNPDLTSIAAMLEEFYTDQLGLWPVDVQIRFAGEGQGVGDDTGTTYTADSWTLTGTAVGGHLPPADCLLVSWRAATGGRSGRGRTFLGPIGDWTLEGNGTPDEAVRTGLQLAADNLIETSDSFGNGALGIYSRTQDTFRDFVAAAVPNKYAVLRSRRD